MQAWQGGHLPALGSPRSVQYPVAVSFERSEPWVGHLRRGAFAGRAKNIFILQANGIKWVFIGRR